MPSTRLHRIAALVVSFSGAILNLVFAARLLTLCHSFRWDVESEWDWLGDKWRVGGVKVVWALLCAYFSLASAVSAAGLAGVIKVRSPHPSAYMIGTDAILEQGPSCSFLP